MDGTDSLLQPALGYKNSWFGIDDLSTLSRYMKVHFFFLIVSIGVSCACADNASAQSVIFFFAAGDLSGEPDRFGNTHKVTPEDAILELPFGHDDLFGESIDEDNKWLIYPVEGNTMLASHAPSGLEDSPELAMEISVAIGGKFEVILNFLDERNNPGAAPIQAALGDGEFKEYSEENSTPATGGTSPGFPSFDGTTEGVMWWQTVSLGEVEASDGGKIKVRIDDATSDFADEWVSTTFSRNHASGNRTYRCYSGDSGKSRYFRLGHRCQRKSIQDRPNGRGIGDGRLADSQCKLPVR